MSRNSSRIFVSAFSFLLCSVSASPQDLNDVLSFEAGTDGRFPSGWVGGPAETIGLDVSVQHRGRAAARIERNNDSDQKFSSLTLRLPADIEGSNVALSAWVRSEGVDGNFGLWLRQDGRAGPVDFANNYNDSLTGSLAWQEISVSASLSKLANTLNFGMMLSGTGTVWIDDVDLLIDGVRYTDVPKVSREIPQWELDTEFNDGSKIKSFISTESEIEKIATVIEVWGFVKYHHPRIAAGDLHIDFELFRILHNVLSIGETVALNEQLGEWLQKLGPIEPCIECAVLPVDAHLPAPIAWIEDFERLGIDLSSLLRQVHQNRPASGDNAFVEFTQVGNANFSNELPYPGIQDVDAGHRLLALARLWNIVQYWFPYRDQIDMPWREVLRQTIPRLTRPLDRESYVREMFRFVAKIQDTHANLWNVLELRPPQGNCAIEADFRFIEGKAVVFPSKEQKQLRRGDVLLEIDGQSISAMIKSFLLFYAASNDAARLRDIGRSLSRGPCGPAQLKVQREFDGEEQLLELMVDRASGQDYSASHFSRDRAGPTYQALPKEVAYIKLSTIRQDDVEGFIEQSQGKKGLIVDIRNYPSSFVPFELGQRLIAKKQPFARVTTPDPVNPGAFVWSETIELIPTTPGFIGPVAILVDSSTQSQAEYTAMALRVSDTALVIGSTTAGADGNSSTFYLPGGIQAMITGLGIFYPDETPTQRIAIVPDIEALPTIRGIRDGRDEILEAALRYILGSDITEVEIQKIAAYP